MVIGASWAGARAFTPTAGPGISLMNEFIGLAYAEVPAVIFDVQRTGPSTGMPTRTQQCDLMMCAYASHGDTRHICIYPGDPREAFEFAAAAFDLAERFQTPVFVLTDLDIGMNDWMVPKLTWDDNYRPDRGKVLTAEELDEVDPSRVSSTPTATASRPGRCRACTRRAYSRGARAQPLRRLHRGRRGIRRGDRSHRSKIQRAAPRCSPSCSWPPAPRRAGHDRRLSRRLHRGARPARRRRHCLELHAGPRLPLRRRRGGVPRAARRELHRRAEP